MGSIPEALPAERVVFRELARDEDVVRYAQDCADRMVDTTDVGGGDFEVRVGPCPHGARTLVQVYLDGSLVSEARDNDAMLAVRAAFAVLFGGRVSRASLTPPPISIEDLE
ncbi:MAG TPA: hypothetical protein RMH85_11600 [Polyangiaceae bacterium LLY-WYZ-15_(1-7)]|nr:hypothetical protein [Myxococcales bacterium]MAT25634.1 hypothetical protein [Sandaracinus sp.]HJK92168.1 hypothetical protein [Polyangiaceae bacterium LLY-WYZ-15_(1-7)]MBJ70600.1 hypothetical protein [Sandaracinus sp.]HJL01815.1 hypothetical protein [Polyangiaceae bacterium LLY-WYZ-15_(1-7)]